MKRARHITRWLATSVAVIALSLSCMAQRYADQPSVARAQAPSHPAGESRTPRPGSAARTSAPRRGLAAATQGFTPRRARTGAAERPALSFPARRATAAAATTAEIFREPSAPGTATRSAVDGPHGEPQDHMERLDAGAAAACPAGSPADNGAPARAAAHGEKRDPRFASHASCAARTGHRFGSLQGHVLASGTRNPARSYPFAAGTGRGWRGTGAAAIAFSVLTFCVAAQAKHHCFGVWNVHFSQRTREMGHPRFCGAASVKPSLSTVWDAIPSAERGRYFWITSAAYSWLQTARSLGARRAGA